MKSNEQHRRNNQRLKRKRNLGEMVETLQSQIPNILTEQISSDLLSRNIILRILPNQYPNLPVLKGWVIATTTLKTLTLVLTSFYLNPKTKLHVSKIQIVEPSDSSTFGQNDLLDLSLGTSAVELSSLENVNRQFLSKYTTKIIFRWRTCVTGCPHLHNSKTTYASKGSFNIDHLDISKLLPPIKISGASVASPKISLSDSSYTESKNQTPDEVSTLFKGTDDDFERVLSGLLIFELSELNDKIVAFTIDDCEIIENRSTNVNTNGLDLAAPGA
ncbi:unnamed protein product [Ambrosiozyma monospora]|uniref:Unnamed protein product n=1 Tax=Ambrosiozyma monospora TaxID=43982 RepID=A0A9W6Z8W4_AMBMO|nr:unnamed protein product [Ambrosiozyma monospora]